MDPWSLSPMLWAQTTAPSPNAVPLLALRRWYSSLTLSSPDPAPNRFGLWAWLLGLAALLLVCLVVQGPGRALRQLFDLPGHARLIGTSMRRLRKSSRLVAITLGATVIAWTVSQAISYSKSERLDDLIDLKSMKSVREIAVEQGVLAALTPLRDVLGLGDNLLLLVAATALAFKLSADRWGSGTDNPTLDVRPPLPPWTLLWWAGTSLYAMFRFAMIVTEPDGLPQVGCLFVEAGVVPLLMVVADGLLLAWVLVELRKGSVGVDDGDRLDMLSALAIAPSAALACLLALPARYVSMASMLALQNVPSLKSWPAVTTFVRGWGLVGLQGGALLFAGLVGAVAWRGGSLGGGLRAYGRTLRQEGGHLVGALAIGGFAAGVVSAAAYFLVLSLPAQPWVLAAADSYAHYATLPIGLLIASSLIELSARALAVPELVPEDVVGAREAMPA